MLTSKQLDDIRSLQRKCEIEDGISLKLNWDMLENRENNENNDYFYYEGNILVGFLALYEFGSKLEICGMVDLEYRRKGIFTSLLDQAMPKIRNGKFKKILLNAPGNSESGKAFVESISTTFDITEYQMKCNEKSDNLNINNSVMITKATDNEFDLEVELEMRCFGFEENEAIEFYHQIRRYTGSVPYIIKYNDIPVGRIRVEHKHGSAWIYSFAILPEYQGKGIGRSALSLVVEKELDYGYPLYLEVEAKNSSALNLYESCGFKIFNSQDYYEYR